MKNVRSIIQAIKDEYPDIFNAFVILDQNTNELLGRIQNIEKRNLQYYCLAYRDGALTVANNTVTPVNLIEFYPQFGNMHDDTTNPAQFIIRRNGVYDVTGTCSFAAGGVATNRAVIVSHIRGGVEINRISTRINQNTQIKLSASGSLFCYVGDVLEFQVLQVSGGNLALIVGNVWDNFMAVAERREDLDPSQYGLLNPEANTY